MLQTYQQSKQLAFFKIRVPKDEAYFVYFTFESHEGLCYYSTDDDSLKGTYRDILTWTPIELKKDLENLLSLFQTQFRLDILETSIISD